MRAVSGKEGGIMIAKTNTRRGMVFALPSGERLIAKGCEGAGIRTTDGSVLLGKFPPFIGMDPEHADRADCERFGIAPSIDAGAHGFARTRDGFAVDLRKARRCPGAVVAGPSGAQLTLTHRQPFALGEGQRFIGLDARHANPEDVERLCCGAAPNDDVGDSRRCTLAIGDHAEHEDIATEVKWATGTHGPQRTNEWVADDAVVANGIVTSLAAEKSRTAFHDEPTTDGEFRIRAFGEEIKVAYDRDDTAEMIADKVRLALGQATRPTCGMCGGAAFVGEGGPLMVALRTVEGPMAKVSICEACEQDRRGDWDRWRIRDGRIVPAAEGVTFADYTRRPPDPNPSTTGGVREKVRCDGYGCEVTRALHGPGTVGVKVFGVSPEYAEGLTRWIDAHIPGWMSVSVEIAKACSSCGCKRTCPWRTESKPDPDALTCEECHCMWCGPRCCDEKNGGMRCGRPKGHTLERHRDTIGREWGEAPKIANVTDDGRWAPGKQSGRCPYCTTGHMERRAKSFGIFMVCVGGCGRSSSLGGDVPHKSSPSKSSGVPTLGETMEQGGVEMRDLAGQMRRLKSAQETARDAAVAKAIADVPEGCDPQRWANVVRVIAADMMEHVLVTEMNGEGAAQLIASQAQYAREAAVEYARDRFVHGYAVTAAVDRSARGSPVSRRIFAAYEAGR
jgi:hypothetical protein